MPCRVLFAPLLAALLAVSATADTPADAAKAKKALQDVGEFVGEWNLAAESKASGKLTSWKETASWGWKFKGDDAWIAVELKGGRHFGKGELRYLPAAKQYQLTATDKDGKPQVFRGEWKRGRLTLERTDAATGDVHRLTVNTLADGVRMVMQYDVQAGGKGLFAAVYRAAGNKAGESFAGGAGGKKPACVVTGGTGTIAVSHMGKTYYVCCSGCRDEFNENPKKYVEAFEKK